EARILEVAPEELLRERVDDGATGTGALANGGGEDLQVDAGLDAQGQDLASRGNLRLRAQVVAELGNGAVAARPAVEQPRAKCGKDWFRAFERLAIATDHDRKRARFGADDAPRDRRIQHRDS